MSHPRLRGAALTAAKVLVSAGLIALAMRGVDGAAVLANLRKADALAVLAAALLITAISILHARRWDLVLARLAHAVPFRDAFKLVLVGYFFNQTLPSTVGGDAYRIWGAYRLGIGAADALTSVIVDRTLALLALVAMIVAGSWWLLEIVRAPLAGWAVALGGLGAVAGMAGLLSLRSFARSLGKSRLTAYLLRISQGVHQVFSSPPAMLQVFGLTIAGYAATSVAVYALAQGMGVELGLGHALLFVPLVALITVLPVSIAGWGLRESSMVVTLGLIGVPSVQAFSLSVLYGLVVMLSGVPGGIIWLAGRGRLGATAQRHPQPHVNS
jgi:glycosyltransferase 2 family protein